MTAKAKKAQGWQTVLPRRMKALRHTVEKEAQKRLDQVTDLLPANQRKTVKQLRADVKQFRTDLRKRGERMAADLRKRAGRLNSDVQKRLEETIEPITSRLDLASRSDIVRLQKRLHELERRLETERSSTPGATA